MIPRDRRICTMLFALAGQAFGSLHLFFAPLVYRRYASAYITTAMQSGQLRFALFALLLLTLPLLLTFHSLFALPRLQDRNHTFTGDT